ncbi:uncharacterized protein LOC119077392 [Bradysia coprophila]|uniref:uncharacterized protein LOC119077392 n=1 Tax=Bradysia coprophila TaxID=38358 RepID=UPI00187D85F7|nr:uncharacterized protein LOC119077392 [Bradysia coprophila]
MIETAAVIPILLAIFISNACSQSVDENALVPVSKITGTNLYTGIYYKMSMKTFPYGWVTSAIYGSTTYVQIELNPNELPNYEPGKMFQFDNQWYFEAVGSSGGYTLTNRMKTDDVLSYLGWYAALSNRESIKATGDVFLIRAQWKLRATAEENYFKVENMQYPGCLLTWVWTMHNRHNYYIQLSYTDYGDDSKFSFKLPTITLKAIVTDFQFSQLPEETSRVLVDKKNFTNVGRTELTYSLNETYPTSNSFTFSFARPIRAVNQTTINVTNLLELSATELIFDGGFEANEGRTVNVTKHLTMNSQVRGPPNSENEVSIFTIWSRIEVPFTATLILSGTTERILKDQPGQVQEAQVPVDLVKEYLSSIGETNLEIVSRVGNNLRISVSGVMKANVGYKTNFELKSLRKEEPKTSVGLIKPLIRTLNLAI